MEINRPSGRCLGVSSPFEGAVPCRAIGDSGADHVGKSTVRLAGEMERSTELTNRDPSCRSSRR